MMFMTAKVDLKKIILILAVIVVVIVAAIALLGKNDTPTAATAVDTNDGRVQFLKDMGWEVTNSPTESGQVKIPKEPSEVFSRYNALQKSQGYDLSQYAGKTVMRYVYKVAGDAEAPVYATLLVYKNQIIGGDITDTSATGAVRSLRKASAPTQSEAAHTEPTEAPATATTAATTAATAPAAT